MHVDNVRICETIFNTVLDTLFAHVEQVILEESLFLCVHVSLSGNLFQIWDKSPSTQVAKEGIDSSPLICMVKVLHKQVKGLDITIYDGKFLNNCV